MTDLSRIHPRHKEIDLQLEHWGRWVVHHPQAWRTQPMFAQYRSHAWQWETPEVKVQGLPGVNAEIERMVSALPDKHRTAIRWAYAWPWVPVNKVRRDLGVTRADLLQLLDDSRDMLINRMRRDDCAAINLVHKPVRV